MENEKTCHCYIDNDDDAPPKSHSFSLMLWLVTSLCFFPFYSTIFSLFCLDREGKNCIKHPHTHQHHQLFRTTKKLPSLSILMCMRIYVCVSVSKDLSAYVRRSPHPKDKRTPDCLWRIRYAVIWRSATLMVSCHLQEPQQ